MLRDSEEDFLQADYASVTVFQLQAVVAIPVYNEIERIEDCLRSLASQEGIGASEFGVLLFLNNCTDGTAHAVAALRHSLRVPIRVIEQDRVGANAGWARREAMEAAAAWLEADDVTNGVILTTDADTRVPHDWVAKNIAVIALGLDAVAGTISLEPEDALRLPDALHARGRLEGAYEALLAELEARINPIPHDPWPRHWTTSGATLAVRLATYREVGGMPPLAVGEDRAFVSSLLSSDARVRHDPNVYVVTSGRLDGRAPGGAADTMKLRCEVPESPCDARLETFPRALLRFVWRRRLRRLFALGSISHTALWAPWLGIEAASAAAIATLPTFGAVIAATEAASSVLTYRPVRPADLAWQIRCAAIVLRVLRVGRRLGGWSRTPKVVTVVCAPLPLPFERADHVQAWACRVRGRLGDGANEAAHQ